MSEVEIQRQSEATRSTEDERTAEDVRVCPDCGGNLVADEGHAEVVCEECGLVVEEDQVDRGPEWRAFDSAERDQKSRVGAPTTNLLHDKGLSSHISWQNQDAQGRTLSSRKRARLNRMRTWDERFRARSHKDRNLKQALGEVDRMGSALGLPKNVRETASVIYRRALDDDLLPGRTIEGVATAAIYAAARQAGSPRTINEVAAVSRVDEMEFKRTYRYIVRELDLGVKLADPSQYVGRFASELDVSDETEMRARELLRTGQNAGVHVGKSPVGLAAAAIYAAARLTGEKLTQSDVSDVANVSEVTIRNRYQELLDAADSANAMAHAA